MGDGRGRGRAAGRAGRAVGGRQWAAAGGRRPAVHRRPADVAKHPDTPLSIFLRNPSQQSFSPTPLPDLRSFSHPVLTPDLNKQHGVRKVGKTGAAFKAAASI